MLRDALVPVSSSESSKLLFHDVITKDVLQGHLSALYHSVDNSPTVNPRGHQLEIPAAHPSSIATLFLR